MKKDSENFGRIKGIGLLLASVGALISILSSFFLKGNTLLLIIGAILIIIGAIISIRSSTSR